MGADTVHARWPVYRTAVDGMLAQMTVATMHMKMPMDAQWPALMDSVHRDLARMPGLHGDALTNALAAHRRRLARLVELLRHMAQSRWPR